MTTRPASSCFRQAPIGRRGRRGTRSRPLSRSTAWWSSSGPRRCGRPILQTPRTRRGSTTSSCVSRASAAASTVGGCRRIERFLGQRGHTTGTRDKLPRVLRRNSLHLSDQLAPDRSKLVSINVRARAWSLLSSRGLVRVTVTLAIVCLARAALAQPQPAPDQPQHAPDQPAPAPEQPPTPPAPPVKLDK